MQLYRQQSLTSYGLDPIHYYSAPGEDFRLKLDLIKQPVFETDLLPINTTVKSLPRHNVYHILSSALTLDASLKHTGAVLELITDLPEQQDMYLFFENCIRGGISTVTHRHAVANNPRLGETYDSSKPTEYLAYLDANNLVSLPICTCSAGNKYLDLKQLVIVERID